MHAETCVRCGDVFAADEGTKLCPLCERIAKEQEATKKKSVDILDIFVPNTYV